MNFRLHYDKFRVSLLAILLLPMNNNLKRKLILAAILVLGVSFFIFNLRDTFLSDDWDFLHISANSSKPVSQFLSHNYYGNNQGGTYRPLVVFFWIFCYRLFGLNPFWFHLVNLIFHALNLFLVWRLSLLVFKKSETKGLLVATIATLFFACFPNHSEAVIWTAAINDTAMVTFYLSSLFFYLKYLDQQKYFSLALSFIMFIFAILTKEMAMTLPLVLLIVHIFTNRKKSLEIKKILPLSLYFLLLAFFFGIRYKATGLFLGYYGSSKIGISLIKILNSYLGVFVSHFFSDTLRLGILKPFLDNDYLTYALFFLTIAGLAFYVKKIFLSRFGLFLALFIISIIPLFSFTINAPFGYFSDESERYAYLPSVFLALLLGSLCSYVYINFQNKKLRVAFTALLVLIFLFQGTQLIIKNIRWYDSARLASKLIGQAISLNNENKYDGLIFLGPPDSNHGVFMFHNNWLEALKLSGLDKTVILSPFAKTLYDKDAEFSLKKINDTSYSYESVTQAQLVLSPKIFKSGDYSLKLNEIKYFNYSSNFKYSGKSVTIDLQKQWIENPKLGVYYFDGKTWVSLK